MKLYIIRPVCLLALVLVCAGCNRDNASSIIELHHQFSMAIGKMEDQIDLIELPGQPFTQSIDIEMKNGLFYISNGASKKVMEFSSYGDLLTLYYNASANPPPVLLKNENQAGSVANRRAHPYPFNEVGEIAVAGTGVLYVQDTVARERRIWDEELGTQLRSVILRFDNNGMMIDYIGQGGISGVPFPYIDSIVICADDILTVVTRTADNWIIFSYDRDGAFRHSYTFSDASLPEVDSSEILSVEGVMAGPEPDLVYVKTDYYQEQSGNEDYGFEKSVIYWIDTVAGAVTGSIEVPPAYKTTGRVQMFNREEEEVIQYLTGIADGGVFFLVSPASDGLYNLSLVDTSGMVVHRGFLELDDSQTVFRKFHVTPAGILTALIGGNTEADIVLWRTDKYINGQK